MAFRPGSSPDRDAPACAAPTICLDCLQRPPAWDAGLTVADYVHPWDALVADLKFHAALDLAPTLARCLHDAVQADGAPLPDRVVPVPLSARRLRERGYNQAWEIARRTARLLGCRAEATWLARWRDAAPQAGLSRAERVGNLRGAFLVDARHRRRLEGLDVAVVDDVMTSGATAHEIATALKQAGARRVRIWVVARTPRDAPGLSSR